MHILKYYGEIILVAILFILSIPVATISFMWHVQKNAWRFGRDLVSRILSPRGDPFK